jgi:glycosyltransferase involved in cell wall biosynthesis
MKTLLYIGNKLVSKGFTASSIDVLGPLLEAEGHKMYYASSKSNKILRFLDMFMAVLKYRNQIDYVLIDVYSTMNFLYAFGVSQMCRFMKLKYIPILHGGNLPNRLDQNPKMSQCIFAHAHNNVAPSRYIQFEFNKRGFSNVFCIPNAIQISQYPFQTKTFDSINLLWVRSFSKIYNPLLAIKILKVLKYQGIRASLCMVGPDKDGSLETTKQEAKALGFDVIFTGQLSKVEWTNLAVNYNIFINTTNFDNMPVSVIEAMALGLPVISTNVGGMPFLIAHETDGILVAPNSENEFFKAIIHLIDYPNFANELAINARKKVEQYDWDVVKHKWSTLLQ